MSRPDWGALQQEYIAEYTRSGISPVAWCEARGLNYATARRYIKKTPKNAQTEMCKTAQKSAQKKSAQTAQKRNEKSQEKKPVFDAGLNEGDAEEFSFCPDEFGISDQQAKFAMLVAQGKKPTEAYRLDGLKLLVASSDNDQYRSRNALIRRHIEKMDASLHVGTKEFDISKVSEVDSVDDLLIDNAARYLLKDWKGVGELVNGAEVALEYTPERGIALLKQNPELYWQILAEAASIAQGKEQQKQDTIKKP